MPGPAVPRLTYFNAKGSALKLRMLLAAASVPYEWNPLEGANILAAMRTSPLGRLPLYEDAQVRLSGSANILLYLGYATSMCPAPPNGQDDCAARGIALACEEVESALWALARRDCTPAARDTERAALWADFLRPALTLLEREAGDGHCVSGRPTFADFAVAAMAHHVGSEYPPTWTSEFPRLSAVCETVRGLGGVPALLRALEGQEQRDLEAGGTCPGPESG